MIIARELDSVEAFVGIHPQIFAQTHDLMPRAAIDSMVDEVQSLASAASGIGEIGLDPKYGQFEMQEYLLGKQLEVARSCSLPLTLHTRGTVANCLRMLSEYEIASPVLFHWFAGTEDELKKVHSHGYYTSFGPAVLYSKRLSNLVKVSDPSLILAETDSPLLLESISKETISPFMLASVIFALSIIKGVPYDTMTESTDRNADAYLKRKPH